MVLGKSNKFNPFSEKRETDIIKVMKQKRNEIEYICITKLKNQWEVEIGKKTKVIYPSCILKVHREQSNLYDP